MLLSWTYGMDSKCPKKIPENDCNFLKFQSFFGFFFFFFFLETKFETDFLVRGGFNIKEFVSIYQNEEKKNSNAKKKKKNSKKWQKFYKLAIIFENFF